jgi:hypothetical protein
MGTGLLPEDGGMMDQAAIMFDAFSVMGAAWSELERKYPKKDARHG